MVIKKSPLLKISFCDNNPNSLLCPSLLMHSDKEKDKEKWLSSLIYRWTDMVGWLVDNCRLYQIYLFSCACAILWSTRTTWHTWSQRALCRSVLLLYIYVGCTQVVCLHSRCLAAGSLCPGRLQPVPCCNSLWASFVCVCVHSLTKDSPVRPDWQASQLLTLFPLSPKCWDDKNASTCLAFGKILFFISY